LSTSLPVTADATWQASLPLITPRIAFVAAVLLLAHVPLLFLHLRSLSEWSDYQFYPYSIMAAIFLTIMAFRSGDASSIPARPRPALACCFLAASWVSLAFGLFVISSPRAGALAFMSTSVAVLLACGKTSLLKRLLPAFLVFGMIVPLPWNLDQLLVSQLQSLTARESGQILDSLGIPNLVQAHSVKLASTTLQVEEGCSGINSLFTILITAILYVCWMKRPLFRSLLLLLTAVGAMLMANLFRVVAVGILKEDFDYDWSSGWRHELLGLSLFGMALLLVGSMDQFLYWASESLPRIPLTWVTKPLKRLIRSRKKQTAPAGIAQPIPLASVPVCFAAPVGAAFGLLLLAQTAWLIPTKFDNRSDAELVQRAEKLQPDRLANTFANWEKTGTEKTVRERSSPFGKYSSLVGFRTGDKAISLEMDYPFFGWHNLTNCYALRGWDVKSTTTRETSLSDQQPGDTVEEILTRGVDDKGFLLYSIHDSGGRILKRPGKGPSKRWLQAHLLSPRGLNIHLCSLLGFDISEHQVYSAEPEWFMPTLQMQLFIHGLKPIEPKDMDLARSYFDDAREVLLRELSPSQGSDQ
jgi:exosortase